MNQRTSLAVLAVLLATITIIGASAYTLFTAERTTSIDVVSDDSGIIQLGPGPSDFVTLVSGELEIDVTNGGATGVNVNSTLQIGDHNDPTNVSGFNITNNDNSKHNITLSYSATTDSSASANVNYSVYDSNGNYVTSFSEESSTTIVDAPAGAKYYVVIEVDTTDLSTSDDLSGTLTVKAD